MRVRETEREREREREREERAMFKVYYKSGAFSYEEKKKKENIGATFDNCERD